MKPTLDPQEVLVRKGKETLKRHELDHLNTMLKLGKDKILVVFRDRSASGMARWFDVYTIDPKGMDLLRITRSLAILSGHTYDRRREALKVRGCGFSAAVEFAEVLTTYFKRPFTYQSL